MRPMMHAWRMIYGLDQNAWLLILIFFVVAALVRRVCESFLRARRSEWGKKRYFFGTFAA